MIRIIAIGKKHEDWVTEGVERYQKRLRAPFDVKWDLLPHSTLAGPLARQKESEAILSRLKDDEFVVLLDETGKLYDSPTLSNQLEAVFSRGVPITLIIGGAYGVNRDLQQRAQITWSLSPLVFPHQLVRLVLIEQLYRAQEIAKGGSYHHD
jgi:23S rRNA (pseudouridine1915-N3)-methyltransferase